MKNSCSLLFSSILFLSILGITEKPIYAYSETHTSHFFADHLISTDKVKIKARESMREEIDRLKESYLNNDCTKKLKEIRKELTSETIISADGARPMDILVSATGTGRTTGHIATLNVANNNDVPIYVEAQNFYIPTFGRHQGYISHIPGDIVIPPHTTTTIPVEGYCTDVTKPPVPSGGEMPDVSEWIPVTFSGEPALDGNYPNIPVGAGENTLIPVNLIPGPSVTEFGVEDINSIITSDEFIPSGPPSEGPILSWPGTDISISGKFNLDRADRKFASVIGGVVKRVLEVIPEIQAMPEYTTPFSADSTKEAESLVQQVIWIFTSGGSYGKTDFSERLYSQYTDVTGRDKDVITEEEKMKLDEGVDDFWIAFQAVGVEAKVIKNEDQNGNQLVSVSERCVCDTLLFDVSIKNQGVYINLDSYVSTTFSGNNSSVDKTADADTIKADNFDKIELKIENVQLKCHCGDDACEPYMSRTAKEEDLNKYYFSVTSTNGPVKNKKTEDNSIAFSLMPKARTENVFITFRIKAYCKSSDCKATTCTRYFQRRFVKEKDDK